MNRERARGSSMYAKKRIESEREPSQVTQVDLLASAPSLNKNLTGIPGATTKCRPQLRSTQRKFFLDGIPPFLVATETFSEFMLMEDSMQIVYDRCCGLDIHKKLIVACVLRRTPQGTQKEIQTFSTMLEELFRLRDWLQANDCQAVAMESTGVYWKPIWNVLEGEMELLLVNAQHIKAVPGRKTDVKDAEWIADLLQHGLLRASFVPPRPQRELREVTRYRTKVVEERARLVNRIQKVLEDANVKLASVASDITGVSGRAILNALLAGQDDPKALAELARGRMRSKREELAQAVQGTLREHHRFLLVSHLRQLDFYDGQIADLDGEVARRLCVQAEPEAPDPKVDEATTDPTVPLADPEPVGAQAPTPLSSQPSSHPARSQAEVIRILDEVTGINGRIAEIVVAELGIRLDQFPSEGHLVSWTGLCPAAKISAGKRLSSKTGKGNRWLRQALIEAAHGAARSKNTWSLGLLSTPQETPGQQESHHGLGPSHLDHHLSPAQRTAILPRTGTGSCPGTSSRIVQALGHPAARAPGLHCDVDPYRPGGGLTCH